MDGKIAKENNLNFSYDNNLSESENADKLLQLSYEAHIDIITIEDLQNEAEIESEEIWKKYPKNRIRFKYIGGGGGNTAGNTYSVLLVFSIRIKSMLTSGLLDHE